MLNRDHHGPGSERLSDVNIYSMVIVKGSSANDDRCHSNSRGGRDDDRGKDRTESAGSSYFVHLHLLNEGPHGITSWAAAY